MLLQIHNAKDNAATVLEELYKYCHFFILDEEAMQYVLHFENIRSSFLICKIFFGPWAVVFFRVIIFNQGLTAHIQINVFYTVVYSSIRVEKLDVQTQK